jgi:hypothetical protein
MMRRILRVAYLGEKLGDTSALENPASLDEIQRAAQRGGSVGRVTPCAPC